MAEINEIKEDQEQQESLMAAINQMGYSEYTRLQAFVTLSQQLKAKQDAIDIMAADPTTSAIGDSYVADTLEPNSQGDLVTLVAKTPGEQLIIDNIYKRLNLPLDKIVYSLFKNGTAILEFAHEDDFDTDDTESRIRSLRSKAANESIEKVANEEILVKVQRSKVIPKVKLISDTTRVFPILHYEEVIGFIEITGQELSSTFDFESDILDYRDVVIHSAEDYVYKKFGFRTESRPLQLKVKMADGSIVSYDIDQGRSLLESAYPSWQTLSIMRDAVNLARLAFSAQAVIISTEVGNMTEPQIDLARNKLKDLFENRLAFGKQGAKSYLQPQIKPNYIYAFTNNGKGAITTSTLGGEYNPGALTDLRYFEDEYFGALGAVKQEFARTEDSGGLDGGGAVEQYRKKWRSNVYRFKRILGDLIKDCINRVLLSRDLKGVYNNFEVDVNQAYREEDLQVVNHQTSKLSMLQQVLEFLEIQDEKKKTNIKLQMIKSVVTDKTLIEALSKAVLEDGGKPDSKEKDKDETTDTDTDSDLDLSPDFGGGSLDDEISSIGSDSDLEEVSDSLDEADMAQSLETGGQPEASGELPPVDTVVDQSQIDEG